MKKETSPRRFQVQQTTRQLALWTLAWLVTMAVGVFGPRFIWGERPLLSGAAILVTTLAGLGMIMAFKRHLQSLDELQQRIQLEAMGIALGVGLVGGLSFSMLDITNLIPFDAEIGYLVALIGLTYLGAAVWGQIRYQ